MQAKSAIRESKIRNMRILFFSLGLQYYVAARYSYFANLSPTVANQSHHAIEMFLKGFLYYKLAGEEIHQEPRFSYGK